MQDARLKDMSWIDFALNTAIRDIMQIIKNTGAVDLEHFHIPVHQIVITAQINMNHICDELWTLLLDRPSWTYFSPTFSKRLELLRSFSTMI